MSAGLHWESHGEGELIVMLHGWAMHGGVLRAFAQTLAADYQVILVDLPGHGKSPAHIAFELPLIAAELLQILPQQSIVFLGWSLGALIALEIAKQEPQRVRALVLLAGTPCFVSKPGWVGMQTIMLNNFAQKLALQPKQTVFKFMALQVYGLANEAQLLQGLQQVLAECEAPNAETLQAGLHVLQHSDLRPVLTSISCPILMILGSRDTLVPVGLADCMALLAPRLRVSILAQAGHVPFISHQAETASLVQDFLRRL